MAGLVCWSCGGGLRRVPRPIRRLTQCPACRCDLHVCRMCRHRAPGTLGECDHERADRVVDKASANFCTYFRPRPDAHTPPGDGRAREARDALNRLFGVNEGESANAPAAQVGPREKTRKAADSARRALNELFDLPEKEVPGDEMPEDEASSERRDDKEPA